ncbi:MAG: RHS repeat-associated core domain-containing protein, partial [Chloroflexi bacterium]|nr:RHS repeat-associated core domain-containing protein [Chloroflexota bacterium]
DTGTGLLYYGARYYDPLLGRFVSADTVVPGAGNPQAFNRYSYVLNNPLRYVDPTGHGGNDPNEASPDFPVPPPDPNDDLAVWIYQALLMVWLQGGAIGQEWVQRWVDNPPEVKVLDLDGWINETSGDVQEWLKYVQYNLGSGQWWGIIPIAAQWLKEKPNAWRASVLIHEFVHTEQYRAAGEGSSSARFGISMAIYRNIVAGLPSLEKERGAEFVQYSIIYHMNDPDAINIALGVLEGGTLEQLTVEICKLVTSRGLAYDKIVGRNKFYILWPPTLGNTGGFPINY